MNDNRKKFIVGVVYYVSILLVGRFLFKNLPIFLEVAQLLYAVIFFLVLPIVLIKKGFKNELKVFNLPVKLLKRQLLIVGLIVFGSSLLIWLFMLQWGGRLQIYESGNLGILKSRGVVKLMLNNLVVLPIGLLAQEFFFRGFLLNVFRKSMNDIFSVVVVSLLFAIFNSILLGSLFGWQRYLGMFVFSLLLGWIVIRLRSVVFSFFVYWWGVVLLSLWVLVELGKRI